MSLSKIHYQAVADILKEHARAHMEPERYASLVKEMGTAIGLRFNSNFRRSTFDDACGADEPEKVHTVDGVEYQEQTLHVKETA